MKKEIYETVKKWVFRNARYLEICEWNCLFEKGSPKAVADALLDYQNEDGGFGHALEPDNTNPASTPVATQYALQLMMGVGFCDMSHPAYQGIIRYLESEKDMEDYGWRFTVPSNDQYPRALWWNYSEESNQNEYYGLTAVFSAFILQFVDKNTSIYKKAFTFAQKLMAVILENRKYGDMGLQGMAILFNVLKEIMPDSYDYDKIESKLFIKVNEVIERDTTKWQYYGVRPSHVIKNPESVLLKGNEEIIKKEYRYLLDTLPENDMWPITWTWITNMEKYNDQFRVSENWWKAIKAIENLQFLINFAGFMGEE